MMSEPVYKGVPNLEIVVFQWKRTHGDCQDCGLPAAFRTLAMRNSPSRKLCAVCAANAAAEDGEQIARLYPID